SCLKVLGLFDFFGLNCNPICWQKKSSLQYKWTQDTIGTVALVDIALRDFNFLH
ncbi:hypothetical protein ACJX0J_014081, partial [Zea mays]